MARNRAWYSEYLEALGTSTEELASLSGLSVRTVRNILNGIKWTDESIGKLHEAIKTARDNKVLELVNVHREGIWDALHKGQKTYEDVGPITVEIRNCTGPNKKHKHEYVITVGDGNRKISHKERELAEDAIEAYETLQYRLTTNRYRTRGGNEKGRYAPKWLLLVWEAIGHDERIELMGTCARLLKSGSAEQSRLKSALEKAEKTGGEINLHRGSRYSPEELDILAEDEWVPKGMRPR